VQRREQEFAREFVYLIRLRANHCSLASLLLLLLVLLGVVEVVWSVPPLYLVSRITSVVLCGDEKETKGNSLSTEEEYFTD